MTLEQLSSLTEDELDLALYVCNVVSPPIQGMEIPPCGLTWFRKGALEQKLLAIFPKVLPEAHPIYSSLLTKLNVQHEIKQEQPPLPVTGSITGSI